MDPDTFERLLKDRGVEKALEMIGKVLPPDMGDFTKEHKTMHACSDEVTDAITNEIKEERKAADSKAELGQIEA